MPSPNFASAAGFTGNFAAGFRGGGGASRAAAAAASVAPLAALPYGGSARAARSVAPLALPYSGSRGVAASNIIDVVARPIAPRRNSALNTMRLMNREIVSTERSGRMLKGTMRNVFSVRSALAGAGAAYGLGQFGRFAINSAMSKQDMLRGLFVTEGSHEAAQQMYDTLGRFQQDFGVMNREELFKTYQKQVMAGISSDDAFGRIALMSDVLAATGGSMQEVNQLMDAIVQIRRAPVLQGDELNQLGEVISVDQIYANLGKILGISTEDARDLQRAGGVSSGHALAAVDMTMKGMGTGTVGELSKMFMDDSRGLLKTFRDRFKDIFSGVHDEDSPFDDLLRSVNSLMLEGTASGTLLRKSINQLYGATFGKAAKYLNTLVEDPQKAAKAIMELRNQVSSIGRAIGGFARGIGDVLQVLRPVVEFIGKLTGGMSEGEVTAARWVGRIFAGVTALNLLNTGVGTVVNAFNMLTGAGSLVSNMAGVTVAGSIGILTTILAGAVAIVLSLIAVFGDWDALGRSLSAAIRGDWKTAWEEWSQAVLFTQEPMMTFFNGLWSVIDSVGNAIGKVTTAWSEFITVDKGPLAKVFDYLVTPMLNDDTAALAAGAVPIDMSRSRNNANGGSSNTNTTMNQTNNINMPANANPEEVAEAVSRRTAQSLERLALAAGHSPRFTT